MLVHNNDEALGVKGKSKDDVDDGPSTPEILLNGKDWPLYDDHLHKEEKMGCGGRWLPCEGNSGSTVLDRPSS